MKKILVLIPIVLACLIVKSQTKNEAQQDVAIVARSYANHIELRYFATSPILFNEANSNGYTIEKAILKQGVAIEKLNYTALKNSPFKRWSNQQLAQKINTVNKNDSNNIKLAGFAYSLTDTSVKVAQGDVLNSGLKTLKAEQDKADNTFAFVLMTTCQSALAAECLGLLVNDDEVVFGTTYVYRIRINNLNEKSKTGWSYCKAKCENFNEQYLKKNDVVKVKEGDGNISFSFPESKEYYAFKVERSDDNGVSFKQLTTTPTIKLRAHGYTGKSDFGYGDSALINYKKYYYRVVVSTIFGDDLLLSEFEATPRDLTSPPPPYLKSAKHISPNKVELIWEMDAKKTTDLKGFNIKRSDDVHGKFMLISKTILPITTTKFVDENFDKNGFNYYIVEAVDTAGNASQSFPSYVTLIDSTPPAVPIVTSATIDSFGIVTIKVKPNIEKDFMGYELQKANDIEHEFSIIHQTFNDSLGNNIFTIHDTTTLKTLTKKVFYKLISFDSHFNQSAPSKIIELTKRDTIPPVSGIITKFSVNDTAVIIYFENSSSEDATKNYLLRREKGVIKFDTIFTNSNIQTTSFIDKKIIGGKEYEYTMIAKDDGGLMSKMSRSILLKTIFNNQLPTPILKGSYDNQTNSVVLNFQIDVKLIEKKIMVEISRKEKKENVWAIFKTIKLDNNTFTDDQIKGAKGMIYTVRLIDSNDSNRTSNFSKVLELVF